jgi:type IV pilus assembly protein PilF
VKRIAPILLLLAGCAQTPAPGSTDAAASGRTDAVYRAQIHTELAGHYYTRGQYSVALAEVKEAMAIDPTHAPAYNVLALVHAKLLEDRQAEASFRKGMELSPTYSEVRNNFGYFLCQRQRYAEALPLFDAALSNPLYGAPEKPLANAGLCALHKGDLPLARKTICKRAMARVRNQPAALLGMAELEMRLRNPTAARAPISLVSRRRMNSSRKPFGWACASSVSWEIASLNPVMAPSCAAIIPSRWKPGNCWKKRYDMMGTLP